MTLNDIFAGLDDDLSGEGNETALPDKAPFQDAKSALTFLMGGKAFSTFESRKSGARFTYKVAAPKEPDGQAQADELRFVAVLTGADNESSYSYIGFVRRGVFFWGRKSRIAESAASVVAFKWTWTQLAKGRLPDEAEWFSEAR